MTEDRFEFRDVVIALLDNALSEAQAGRCHLIEVELGDDAVRVTDDGVGLPVHPHPQSGRSLLEVIMTGPRRGPRNTLAKVNSSCLWAEVVAYRGGTSWRQRYELARPVAGVEEREEAGQGTSITCAPVRGDPPTFGELKEYLQEVATEVWEILEPLRSEGEGELSIRLLDRRESRDETIVIGR